MEERNQKICEHYKEGYSLNQCAYIFGLARATICYILDKYEIKRRPVGNSHNKMPKNKIKRIVSSV